MSVHKRYYGWDNLPAETARAGRGSETCTIVSLQSTRIALEAERAKLKAGKKPAKVSAPTQKAFIQAFVQPNALADTPWRNISDKYRCGSEFMFYQQETSCVFYDMHEGVVWSHAKLDGVWMERGFCVASVADLHPAFREIFGDATLLIVHCAKAELPKVFNGLVGLLARAKGKELPLGELFRRAFYQQDWTTLLGKRVMQFNECGHYLWLTLKSDWSTVKSDSLVAKREDLPECYQQVLGEFDVLVLRTRNEITLLARNLNRILKGGEW